MILEFIIVALLSYLLGSINFSIFVSKYIYGINIRQYGSGNAGATNTLRTLGKTAAILVVMGDLAKGVFSVLIGGQIAGSLGMLLGGLLCIIGHNWPIYFNFKGGKGVLTSLAVIITLDWKIGIILMIIGVLLIAIFRFVSLGSIAGSLLLPIFVYYMPSTRDIPQNQFLYFSIIISILAVVRHRKNISRLIKGNESKIGQKISVK